MKGPTAEERRHIKYVASLPCLVCHAQATVHHVTASIHGGRMTRSHQRIVPLCPIHHQAGHDPYANRPVSVERLGHRGFWQVHGIDLLAEADRLWSERMAA